MPVNSCLAKRRHRVSALPPPLNCKCCVLFLSIFNSPHLVFQPKNPTPSPFAHQEKTTAFCYSFLSQEFLLLDHLGTGDPRCAPVWGVGVAGLCI